MESNEINQRALNLLSKQEYHAAQKMFFVNALKHPSHQTFNNLGVFLVTEGLCTKNAKSYYAHKLGGFCLKISEKLNKSDINLCAIARLCYSLADRQPVKRRTNIYKLSCSYLERAQSIKYSDSTMYNIVRLRYLIDSKNVLLTNDAQRLLMNFVCDESVSLYFDMLQSNALFKEGLKCIERYREHLDDVDLLMFYAKFGMYEDGFSMIQKVLDHAMPNEYITSAIIECCINSAHADDMQLFLAQIVEVVNDIYQNTYRKTITNWIYELKISPEKRKELIASYSSPQPFLDSCYYFGCNIHKTPWIM